MLFVNKVFSKSQITILVASTTPNLSIICQKLTIVGSSTHLDDILSPQFFYLNWKRRGLIIVDTKLSPSIRSPSPVCKLLSFLDFGHRVIPTTPHIDHMVKPYSIKCKTRLSFPSVVDSSPSCVRFWLSSTE